MNEFGVIIGQFQPFTNTHLEVVRFALLKSNKVIIVLGSDSQPRTVASPWSSDERARMIRESLTPEENARIEFVRAKDYLYNENLWIAAVQQKVDAITDGNKDVALIGHKDKINHYLNQFPQWTFIETGNLSNGTTSEHIKEMYFTLDLLDVKRTVPEAVFEIMKHDMMIDAVVPRPEFMKLKEEYHHVKNYKAMWASSPFPPTFITVDAVVIKSGHVLVVRRLGQPGKGLIALPGGFVNQNELILDACLRELKEETQIKLRKDELLSMLRDQRVFDHPKRSLRGRTITHAFCFNLGQGPLPRVKGDDDADKAWWMPLRDVLASEDSFFEDHFHIINHFVNKF